MFLRYCVVPVSLFLPKNFNPFQFLNNTHFYFIPSFSLSSSSTSTNDVDNAVSMFNHLLHKNPTPPDIKFGKILSSLVKSKHYHNVVSLSQKMEFVGIKLDLVNCSILINSFCQLGHTPFAFSVLAKILKNGYEPDTITFTTLIKGLCLKGDIHQALHFHDKVIAMGFHLDKVGYGTLINGLCKVGETKAALELLRRVDGKLVDEAINLFEEMHCRKLIPDVVTYNSLIDGLCKSGKISYALKLVDEMHDRGQPPDIIT
ncbi:putative pentatricopeptide [Medicago truncatula]|uniref:Putative pentatricopeptide n=1 Tax=Medicago truncatula TaxID=3880 RepID=A0A396HJ89_MEDTR|nr:putative pentatricopeptide [Medicago truncatula]